MEAFLACPSQHCNPTLRFQTVAWCILLHFTAFTAFVASTRLHEGPLLTLSTIVDTVLYSTNGVSPLVVD